jgi:hypothetical protein
MDRQRIIVSSGAMLKLLTDKMEFWKDEVKIKVGDGELQIDGFRYLGVEHQSAFETQVTVEKLRKLRRFLLSIEDQPITMWIGWDHFKINQVLI